MLIRSSGFPVEARRVIEDSSNDNLLSVASVWEGGIKYSLQKLTLELPFDEFFEEGLKRARCSLLPIELSHVCQVSSLQFHHRNPFDRLLVAQCLVEQLPLVGRDSAFDTYGVNAFGRRLKSHRRASWLAAIRKSTKALSQPSSQFAILIVSYISTCLMRQSHAPSLQPRFNHALRIAQEAA